MSDVPFQLVQTRKISGKGILKVPETSLSSRALSLIVTVDRLPVSLYLDNDYNPPKQKFGTMTFLRDGNVMREDLILFQNQVYDIYPPYDNQAFLEAKCLYAGLLESIANLGTALGVTPVSITNQLKDWDYLTNCFDTIKVVCWSSAVVILDLYAQPNYACDEADLVPKRPPKPNTPPPSPKPPTQPGTTPPTPEPVTDISPPYDGANNDGGDTSPYTGDSPPPPPDAAYTIKVVGSSYGSGCIVFPIDDIYITLHDTGSGNYALVQTGASAQCGGFDFVVKDADQNRVIYTNTSPGKDLHLEVTAD